jgi:hypothetical protein
MHPGVYPLPHQNQRGREQNWDEKPHTREEMNARMEIPIDANN